MQCACDLLLRGAGKEWLKAGSVSVNQTDGGLVLHVLE